MFPRPIRKARPCERPARGRLGAGLLSAMVLGALAGLLPAPASAVINGTTTRDRDGARSFVVRIESTEGEICSGTLIAPDLVLSADLSRRPFTGMIHVTGAADRDVPHLADLIGANWRRDGKSWILAERATAP